MSVDNLIESIKRKDRQAITESLQELINNMAKDQKVQEEIIQNLTEEKLTIIFDCFEDTWTDIRKLAAKFVLDLVYDNYFIQLAFCELLGIIPSDGKVCINSIPLTFKTVNRHLPECFEALKHENFEDTKDQSVYGWYLHVQEAEKANKKVVPIFANDRDLLIENNAFFDPFYSMIGFVVKNPKKETTEKMSFRSRISDSTRPNTSPNDLIHVNLTQENSTLLKQTSPERKMKAKEALFSVTTKRKPLIKNPLANLQQMSSRTTKANINSSLLTPTTIKGIKPDKSNNKTAIITTEGFDDAHVEKELSAKDLELEISPVNKNNRMVKVRKTEPTIEPIDRFQEFKPNASINEVSETTSKVLDSSLNSSQNGVSTEPKSKSKNVNTGRPSKLTTEKTLTFRDKNTSSLLTTDELSSSQLTKNRLGEIDKKSQIRTPKGAFTTNSSAVSNKSAVNSNLLNKILKAKPSSKEKLQNTSQVNNNQKAGIDKTSFWEFIHTYRKINAAALSSVLSSGTKGSKSPINNPVKKEDLTKSATADTNKKRIVQTSLLQEGGANNSLREKYEALDEDLSLEATPKANGQSSRKSNEPPLKNYHLSAGFKNPIASSRVSQEIKKESLTAFGKLLSPRKSHDVTYLANHKKKIDASATIQNSKNKKVTKKVNQTVTDSPRIK